MNKLIGIKWGSLREDTKADLLERAYYEGTGDVTVDLTESISVAGTVINNEEEKVLEISDNSILYDPIEGVVLREIKNIDNLLFDIMTVTEAAEQYYITEGAIRNAISNKKFIVGIDYRKAGRITLISRESMERVYGER